MNRLALVLVVALVGACATDDPVESCEVECPRPPDVVQHVEDLRHTEIRVDASSSTDLTAPAFTTITVKFDHAGLSVRGCPVLDPGLSVSVAGVPGKIKFFGGAFRGARWQCGDLELELSPMVHAASARLVISDDTGELSFELGDVLLDRSVEAVNNPTWTFTDGQPATFRWSPASDVAPRSDIVTSWGKPTATVEMVVPITHIDDATFTVPLPPGAGTELWLIVPAYRGCGASCTLYASWTVRHTATLTP